MKRIFWVLLVALACSAESCDVEKDAQGYTWTCDHAAVEPVRVHRGVDVYLNCAFEMKAESCSVRRPDGCDIYLPEKDREQAWYEPHERKHCGGCRHQSNLHW